MSLKKKVTVVTALTLSAMLALTGCSGSTTASDADDGSLMTVQVYDDLPIIRACKKAGSRSW